MEYQLTEPMSEWFFWFFLIGMLSTFVTWIAFARLSMSRIERAMRKDGLIDTFTWDGLGGRIVFFALAIVLPVKLAHRINALIDVAAVRKYSSNIDWFLGFLFLACGDIWILGSIIAVIFDLD
jgi:hypothetical protein